MLGGSIFLSTNLHYYTKQIRRREKTMTDNDLRKDVKLLKATQNISYKEIAYYLEVKTNSLYNWLRGSYDFSHSRKIKLEDILTNLKE